jgi:uncharacterized protein (DUF1778 family)
MVSSYRKKRMRRRVASILPDSGEVMILTGADREAFLEALLNPAPPTDRLVAAMKRHRELVRSARSPKQR